MSEAQITVIIPCYNQGHYLTDAVQSVIAQTYTNWECLIVDDGSTDNTKEVAARFCKIDKRVKYIYKENGGLSSARNKGLEEAKGEFIQFLDSDDIIAENKFSASAHEFLTTDIIISNFKTFTEKDQLKAPSFRLHESMINFHSLLMGWDEKFVLPIHTGLFRSALFDNLRFNEKLKAKEDWLMWLQIYQQKVKTVFIDKPYALYRSTPNSMSQEKSKMDKSLIDVFRLIYPILPENEKQPFFEKAMNTLEQSLSRANYLVEITRHSRSFRLGNFFIKRFKWLQKT